MVLEDGSWRCRRGPRIMPKHTLRRLACTAAFVASVAPGLLAGQQAHSSYRRDLSGTWANGTATPLERPAEFKDRKWLSDEEAARYEEGALQRLLDAIPPVDRMLGADLNYTYLDYHRVVEDRRTSLIVDPPDGRIPALVPQAQARLSAPRPPSSDDPETRTFDDRCIISMPFGAANAVPPIVPNPFAANYYQIVQTPDYVMILSELLHDARIIKLNGAHLPAHVQPWLGDSVGRWEGDTLVVETTNFSAKT